MIDNWRDAFDEAFSRNDKHKARNFASMALEARNTASHLAIPMADDEALRYLDAIHQLLRLVKAPEAEVVEAKKLYEAQRRVVLAAAPVAPPAAPAPQKLELLRNLDRLQQAVIEKDGKRIVTRTHVEGMVGRVFQAAGIALPPHMRELTNQTT